MSEPNHEPFDGLAALYAAGALSARERAEFEAHLELCRACGEEVMSLLPVTHGLARAVPPRDAPTALRRRVLEAVAASGTAGRTPNLATAPGSASAVSTGFDTRPPAARTRAGGVFLGLATAASLLLAVGFGWFAWQQFSLARELQGELDAALQRAQRAELEVSITRQTLAETQQRNVVLAAPDLFVVVLAGQPVAPEASGRAFWSSSRGLVFAAAGLPALPAGRVYQLWFVPGADPVSAGLLVPDEAGRVTLTVEIPVAIGEPAPMAVSIEPEGGVTSPTGDLYLLGQPSD